MLKYYEYLVKIRLLVRQDLHIEVLDNLDKFPRNQDPTLQEYYTKIAEVIYRYPHRQNCSNEKYYITKVKPFFVGKDIFYEVTLTSASTTSISLTK